MKILLISIEKIPIIINETSIEFYDISIEHLKKADLYCVKCDYNCHAFFDKKGKYHSLILENSELAYGLTSTERMLQYREEKILYKIFISSVDPSSKYRSVVRINKDGDTLRELFDGKSCIQRELIRGGNQNYKSVEGDSSNSLGRKKENGIPQDVLSSFFKTVVASAPVSVPSKLDRIKNKVKFLKSSTKRGIKSGIQSGIKLVGKKFRRN